MFTTYLLTRGRVTLVDTADVPCLAAHHWMYHPTGYTVAAIQGKTVYLHRFLMAAQRGQLVDHIDGDKLNNTRANLRLVTPRQNTQNQRPRRHASSQYKGVSQRGSRWQARIRVNGTQINLGTFNRECDAAMVYDTAARHFFGDYAHTNFSLAETPDYFHAYLQYQLNRVPRVWAEKRPSPYRGVSWHRGQWRAKIKVQGHSQHLGCFDSEEKAARAYDYHAQRYHGDRARLNFPPPAAP